MERFTVTNFIIDYSICNLIAYAIILIFEYFWFSRYQLMKLFIRDTQADVIRKLYRLIHLLNQDKISRSDWFESCITYTDSLFAMQLLAQNAQFVISSERAVSGEFHQFVALNNDIFISLKALYLATYTKKHRKYDFNQLLQKVQADLKLLKNLMKEIHIADQHTGELHVAPN